MTHMGSGVAATLPARKVYICNEFGFSQMCSKKATET